MTFETLTLPSELAKIDQQIQKLSGADWQHAHRSVSPVQAPQCLNPDLILNNLHTDLLLATVLTVTCLLCMCFINRHLP